MQVTHIVCLCVSLSLPSYVCMYVLYVCMIHDFLAADSRPTRRASERASTTPPYPHQPNTHSHTYIHTASERSRSKTLREPSRVVPRANWSDSQSGKTCESARCFVVSSRGEGGGGRGRRRQGISRVSEIEDWFRRSRNYPSSILRRISPPPPPPCLRGKGTR